MSKSDAERLDDLEILAAHQVRTIDDLNEVVVEQGRIIAELRRRLDVLTKRFAETEAQLAEMAPAQKPPHW